MALKEKKKIRDIEVTNNSDQIVVRVFVEWNTYDTIDPEEFKEQENKIFELEIDDADPNSDTFVPFENLTEEIIFGWLSERLQSPRILEMEKRMRDQVSSRVNPPEPISPQVINKGLPWNND